MTDDSFGQSERRIYGLAIQAAKYGTAIGIGHLQRLTTLPPEEPTTTTTSTTTTTLVV